MVSDPQYGIDLITKTDLDDEISYWERKAEHHAKELDLAKCTLMILSKLMKMYVRN